MKCPKCGSKLALAKTYVDYFEWDEEPYENGKKENVKNQDGDIIESPNIIINIIVWICPDCNFYNFDREAIERIER
jgi:rubrerythrin